MAQDSNYSRVMTVANLREYRGDKAHEVVFLESAQFYHVGKDNPALDSIMAILRAALAAGSPVEVILPSMSSNLIDDVKPAPH